jgi:hypothetical protein
MPALKGTRRHASKRGTRYRRAVLDPVTEFARMPPGLKEAATSWLGSGLYPADLSPTELERLDDWVLRVEAADQATRKALRSAPPVER